MPDISFCISLLKLNREHSHSCDHLSFCWAEKCKSFSYKTFLLLQSSFLPVFICLFFVSMFKIQIFITPGDIGKTPRLRNAPQNYAECEKVKDTGPKSICTCTGKLKWTRKVPASRSPRLPVVHCPAWGSIHFNYEEMLSEARPGLQRGSPHFR